MYQPVAVLVYQIPNFIMNQQAFFNNSQIVSSDPLLIVGARLVSEQVTQMQTLSIGLQIVVYLFFLAGSVKILGMVTQASGKFGSFVGGYGERMITAASTSLKSSSKSSTSEAHSSSQRSNPSNNSTSV